MDTNLTGRPMSRNLSLLQSAENMRGERHPPRRGFSPANGANKRQGGATALVDEEVIKLVQSVFILSDSVKTPHAVAFCGVEEGVGCSWLCARASEVLAEQVGASVCVVDANLQAPSLHEYFRVENKPGLAEALRETTSVHEFVEYVERSNIWLMTAGSAVNELLYPSQVRSRAAELRSEFDFVLIDTPSILSSGDACLLAQGTDGAILVVGFNMTRRESARKAKEGLEAAGVGILGAVLNKRIFPIPEPIYKRL
jgi:polysaccharide biosynthesis transport protein